MAKVFDARSTKHQTTFSLMTVFFQTRSITMYHIVIAWIMISIMLLYDDNDFSVHVHKLAS